MNQNNQLLVFCLEEHCYGIHLGQVLRVVRSVEHAPLPQAPGIVLGVIDVQGEIVPLLDIRRRFGCPQRDIGADDQFIIAQASRRTVALVVDRVKGVVEHSAEDVLSAEKIYPHLEEIEGVIKLPDGLTLIHDLDRFLSLEEAEELEQALTRRPADGS